MTNNRIKTCVVLSNAMFMFIVVYALTYEAKLKGDDYSAMIAIIIGAAIQVFVFIFVNTKNMASTALEEIKLFEFEQYKTMFNSLQEGIIVIDTPASSTSETKDYALFFINEVQQIIMNKIFKLKQDKPTKNKHTQQDTIHLSRNIKKKVFYEYRSEYEHKEGKSSRKPSSNNMTSTMSMGNLNSFSLFDVLKMSQNELSLKVFMFDSKKVELFNSKMEFTDI